MTKAPQVSRVRRVNKVPQGIKAPPDHKVRPVFKESLENRVPRGSRAHRVPQGDKVQRVSKERPVSKVHKE